VKALLTEAHCCSTRADVAVAALPGQLQPTGAGPVGQLVDQLLVELV